MFSRCLVFCRSTATIRSNCNGFKCIDVERNAKRNTKTNYYLIALFCLYCFSLFESHQQHFFDVLFLSLFCAFSVSHHTWKFIYEPILAKFRANRKPFRLCLRRWPSWACTFGLFSLSSSLRWWWWCRLWPCLWRLRFRLPCCVSSEVVASAFGNWFVDALVGTESEGRVVVMPIASSYDGKPSFTWLDFIADSVGTYPSLAKFDGILSPPSPISIVYTFVRSVKQISTKQ